jgi:hypothetical protein
MQRVGPATQTLGAVRALASRTGETFASVKVIADKACLPERTVERHLRELVTYKWLEYRPRQRRRTPTYIVPKNLLNRNSARKFAILPRWAAWLLPTWAERAVFASIVSRDSLLEVIEEIGSDSINARGDYSVKVLAAETGLSRQAIADAKRELQRRGLIQINQAMFLQDQLGRFRTGADILLLNADFRVPANLIDRRLKMADCKGNDTLHRSLKVADTMPKNGGPVCLKVADTMPKNGGCSYRELLKEPITRTTERTSELRSDDSLVLCEKEFSRKEGTHEEKPTPPEPPPIDIEDRRGRMAETLRGLLAAESADTKASA